METLQELPVEADLSEGGNDLASESSWSPGSICSEGSDDKSSSSDDKSSSSVTSPERKSKRSRNVANYAEDTDDDDDVKKPKTRVEKLKKASKNKKRGRPNKSDFPAEESAGPKSELELLREKNVIERKIMLDQLGLMKAKADLEESATKTRVLKAKKPVEIRVLRQRYDRKAAHHSVTNAVIQDVTESIRFVEEESLPVTNFIASDYKAEDVDLFMEVAKIIHEDTSKYVSECELSSIQFPVLKSRVSALRQINCLSISEMSTKFTTIAFHPSTSPLLLAAGTKSGTLALWKVPQNVERVNCTQQSVGFNLHTAAIKHVTFKGSLPHFLFTNSKDGTLKSLDINKLTFNLIYKVPNVSDPPICINWQAHPSPHVILAATTKGSLVRLDIREDNVKPSSMATEFKCHEGAINTVDVCGDNSILTASDDGSFSMWDMRKMRDFTTKAPILGSDCLNAGRKWSVPLSKPVSSAFFCPQGGSRMLVSTKEVICVYDHGHRISPFKTYSALGSSFAKKGHVTKSFWHPMRKDVFLVGISQPPMPGVHLFHAKHHLKPSLPSQADLVIRDSAVTKAIFHPSQMMIAGCCGSKIHLYQ